MARFKLLLVAIVLVFFSLNLAGCAGKKETVSPPTETQQPKEEPITSILAKGKQIEGMSYDFTMTAKEGVMSGKVWIQGKKIKTESIISGQKIISFFDADTNTVITYYPEQNRAMKLSVDSSKKTETPTDYSEKVQPEKVKVLETTVYDGVKCKVILIISEDGKEQIKMWVSEDYGIPIRIESTGADGSKMVMEYKNLKVGPQPQDTFKLPEGVEVIDMSKMMEQLPQKP